MHPAVARELFEKEISQWSPEFRAAPGRIFHALEFPIIDCEFTREGRTAMRIRMNCSQWDAEAPSVELQNSQGTPFLKLPGQLNTVFNGGPHRATGKPFLCIPGVKEFHIHESHLNERWDQFRGKPGFSLGEILMKIWHAWLGGQG